MYCRSYARALRARARRSCASASRTGRARGRRRSSPRSSQSALRGRAADDRRRRARSRATSSTSRISPTASSRALDPAPASRVYNLVGDESTSVREIADDVRELVGDVPIVHVAERAGDLTAAEVSASAPRASSAGAPTTPFDDGLRALRRLADRDERLARARRPPRGSQRQRRRRPAPGAGRAVVVRVVQQHDVARLRAARRAPRDRRARSRARPSPPPARPEERLPARCAHERERAGAEDAVRRPVAARRAPGRVADHARARARGRARAPPSFAAAAACGGTRGARSRGPPRRSRPRHRGSARPARRRGRTWPSRPRGELLEHGGVPSGCGPSSKVRATPRASARRVGMRSARASGENTGAGAGALHAAPAPAAAAAATASGRIGGSSQVR